MQSENFLEIRSRLVSHMRAARSDRRAKRGNDIHDNEVHALVFTDFLPSEVREAERRTRVEFGDAAWSKYRNWSARQTS